MSERLDDNIEHLNQSVVLWDDVRKIAEDVESWTGSCVLELNESLNNLNDSQKVSKRLSALQVQNRDEPSYPGVSLRPEKEIKQIPAN